MKLIALLLLFAVPAYAADPKPKTFPAGDGCNTCTTSEMGTTCTLLACTNVGTLFAPSLSAQTPAATADAPRETCADAPPDVTGESVCLEQGEPAPFRARALSFPEHLRREKVNARNADLWDGITQGQVLVVNRGLFYAVITGGAAAIVVSILFGFAAALHKL